MSSPFRVDSVEASFFKFAGPAPAAARALSRLVAMTTPEAVATGEGSWYSPEMATPMVGVYG